MQMNVAQPRRYRALDGIRGCAALIVVFYHMTISSVFKQLSIVQNGELAVDLFFVLSGFVISSAYVNRINSTDDIKKFLTLRFFRVYPLHLVMLVFFFGEELVKLYLYHKGVSINNGAPFTGGNSVELLVATFFLVQAWGGFGKNLWNGPSWSISCEAFAYLVFAALAPLRPFRWRYTPLVIVVFALISYIYAAMTHDGLGQAIYGPAALLRGLSGFLIGALCFHWTVNGALGRFLDAMPGRVLSLAQIGVFVLFVAIVEFFHGAWSSLAIVPLVFMVVVLCADRGVVCDFLNTRPIQYLGEVSYSIYMIHIFILFNLDSVLKRLIGAGAGGAPWYELPLLPGTLLSIALALVIVALASVAFRLVENPGREFGRRLFRKKAAPVPAAREAVVGE